MNANMSNNRVYLVGTLVPCRFDGDWIHVRTERAVKTGQGWQTVATVHKVDVSLLTESRLDFLKPGDRVSVVGFMDHGIVAENVSFLGSPILLAAPVCK